MKVVIMRGVPGSGKSTQSKALGLAIASADEFPGLYVNGQIQFGKLDSAHGACFKRALMALADGMSVVVDNTNLSVEEVVPYVALARAYQANVEIVNMDCDYDTAFGRQTHNVPRAVFDAMCERYEAFVPLPFWGDWLTIR